jgi:hypothetical protein
LHVHRSGIFGGDRAALSAAGCRSQNAVLLLNALSPRLWRLIAPSAALTTAGFTTVAGTPGRIAIAAATGSTLRRIATPGFVTLTALCTR